MICVKVNGNGDKKLIFGLIKDFIDAAKTYGEGDYKAAMKAYKTACDDAAALATKEALAAGLVGEARCQIMLGHLKKATQISE